MTEARIAGRLNDAEARSIYVEMTRVAERDLTGDALTARLAEIKAMAAARGWEFPADDPRTAAQVEYDGMFREKVTTVYGHEIGQPWQAAGPGGFPAVVTPGDLQLYRNAPADGAAPDAEAEAIVSGWLRTAAAPEQGAELLKLAKGNSLVMQSLHSYATIATRYRGNRPR
jgi:hypothetical protein